MIRNLVRYPLQFILLILVQVLVLNNIQFSGYINPFLYILFILWLPVETPNPILMVLAFLMGLSIDIFSETLGLHTSAAVFLAFCRPFILKTISPRDGYELNQIPSMNQLGTSWFLIYALLCTFAHHFFLFFVEVFSFDNFFNTLGRVIASTFFSLILIVITQFFSFNKESKK